MTPARPHEATQQTDRDLPQTFILRSPSMAIFKTHRHASIEHLTDSTTTPYTQREKAATRANAAAAGAIPGYKAPAGRPSPPHPTPRSKQKRSSAPRPFTAPRHAATIGASRISRSCPPPPPPTPPFSISSRSRFCRTTGTYVPPPLPLPLPLRPAGACPPPELRDPYPLW